MSGVSLCSSRGYGACFTLQSIADRSMFLVCFLCTARSQVPNGDILGILQTEGEKEEEQLHTGKVPPHFHRSTRAISWRTRLLDWQLGSVHFFYDLVPAQVV